MDELTAIPPFLPLYLGALALALLPALWQRLIWLLTALAVIAALFGISDGHVFSISVMGKSLHLMAIHKVSMIFGAAFGIATCGLALLAPKHAAKPESIAAMILAGSGLGVIFAGDLISLVLFWEMLMFASAYLIYAGRNAESMASAKRYLILHIFGGALLLAGASGLMIDSGLTTLPTLSGNWMQQVGVVPWAGLLMLIGVLINVTALPFSAWLPDSYPEASRFGMAALAIFTTKSALFVLIRCFSGTEILIPVGLATLVYGGVMALLQPQIRRYICYTIIAQLGLMTAAVGIGTEAAIMGAAALAFCHIGYTGLLITASGSAFGHTKSAKLARLSGLCHRMHSTAAAMLLGVASMAALPLTGAYFAKSLISEGMHSTHNTGLDIWLYGGLLIPMFMMIPWFMLRKQKTQPAKRDVPIDMQLTYLVFALMAIAPIFLPDIFHVKHILGDWAGYLKQIGLLCVAALLFIFIYPRLKPWVGKIGDIDILYRKHIPQLLIRTYYGAEKYYGRMRSSLPAITAPAFLDVVSRRISIGTSLFMLVILLCLFLGSELFL